jgi:peptidoglycan/xylan/chitin deacetylase (PgdA/CDA1 family)
MSNQEPTLLIGYDVERDTEPAVVSNFLERAEEVHSDLDAPCTFFILGRVIENNGDELAALGDRCDLIDYQQHTYSHVLLKTVYMDDGNEITLVRGGTLEQIEEEVSRTNVLLKERLGVDCMGLTGPWAYYRGLCDRPDILDVLARQGIRFTRTWGRNEKDFQPVPFHIRPFRYEIQGHPEMMEFPLHGWQDVHWKMAYGWEKTGEYLDFLKETVDVVAEKGLLWSYGSHDWSSIREDPQMSTIRGFIEYAKDSGLDIVDYSTYYKSHPRD